MTIQKHRIGDIGRRQKIRNVTQGILLVAATLGQSVLLAWLLFGTEALPWILAAAVLVGILRPRVPTRWVLAMYGAQPIPYSHTRTSDPVALRSHPATADRIRRLRQFTPDADQQSLLGFQEPATPPTYPQVTRPPRLHFPGIRW